MSSDISHLLDTDDLREDQVDRILAGPDRTLLPTGSVVATVFWSSSLRTRVGFHVAATRLGANVVNIFESRGGADMSAGESLMDTLRTTAQMADLIVTRPDEHLDRPAVRREIQVPVINGGDPGGQHPTQALIDVTAIQRFRGPLGQIRLGVCGDLTMRASRSLLALLSRRPPRSLTLIAPPSRRDHGLDLSPALRDVTELREPGDLAELDVLLLTGLAPGTDQPLAAHDRARYALNATTVRTLAPTSVVLSPGPVIDEIAPDQRRDPRVMVDEQARLAVDVRVAVLQEIVRAGAGRQGLTTRSGHRHSRR